MMELFKCKVNQLYAHTDDEKSGIEVEIGSNSALLSLVNLNGIVPVKKYILKDEWFEFGDVVAIADPTDEYGSWVQYADGELVLLTSDDFYVTEFVNIWFQSYTGYTNNPLKYCMTDEQSKLFDKHFSYVYTKENKEDYYKLLQAGVIELHKDSDLDVLEDDEVLFFRS